MPQSGGVLRQNISTKPVSSMHRSHTCVSTPRLVTRWRSSGMISRLFGRYTPQLASLCAYLSAKIDGKLRQDVIEIVWKFGQINRFSFGEGREPAFQLIQRLWKKTDAAAAG